MYISIQIFAIICSSTKAALTSGCDAEHLVENEDEYQSYDDKPPILAEEYDFIIIGGGTSGSVIANRLSEISEWNVLLIEAGGEPTYSIDIPTEASALQFSEFNWGYLTEKQNTSALGLVDGKMHWPRGKVLGGSSAINHLIYTRGNKEDYDRWESLGNQGWSYKDLLPLFRKLEDSRVRLADPKYHGTGGYLSVEDVSFRTISARTFIAAAEETGHKYVDYNGRQQLGVSFLQATTSRSWRCSSEKAFLRRIRRIRPNLTITTESFVTKILINEKTKRAYGVQLIRKSQYYTIRVTKEVVLSAGVINSPQLLILSGIGAVEDLRELNISVIQNLQVGKTLYDHIAYPGLLFTANQSIVFQESMFVNPDNFQRFVYKATGPIASLGGPEAILFFKTNTTNYTGNYPDIELLFVGGGLQTDDGQVYRRMMRVTDEIYNALWKPLEDLSAWSLWPLLLHPKSRGYLKLKSKDPFDRPLIYANYYTDPKNEDIKTMIAAIREVQRIAAAPVFRQYDTRPVTTAIPGCRHYKYDSDKYWECALRHTSSTEYHPTSTCKMGPINDSEAVVDSKLRVYGVQGLRVADASIFPTAVSGHTNSPSFMVGEKASEMIKEDWLINDLH